MLTVKPFLQSTGHCGPAALKMVLGYYGVHKSEAALAKLSNTSRIRGVEGPALVRTAQRLGFTAFLKDCSTLADIRRYVVVKKIPVIVDWFSVDDGHYSVIVGINRKNIYLQDPEWSRRRAIDLKTFKRVWFDFPRSYAHFPRDFILRRMIVMHPRGSRKM
jgi:uncharacterized protein